MQTADTKMGNYYVTAVKSGRVFPMLGPFVNDHAAALERVEDVSRYIDQSGQDPFRDVATGTVRMAETFTKPGKLNAVLGMAS